ncbi:MAG: ATP-binding protein, partial [Pantoea agglomerans]
LAGLRLHLELIERNSDVKVQPLVQRLDQMTHSVSQLLNLARAGQSFTSGTYQNVGLIEDVILPMEAELSIMLEAHQQTLVLDLPQEQFVRGDATLLKMLLRNLVENAYRYSPDNSTISVQLVLAPQPMLVVEDQGPGIDESKSGELSKAFIRMDSRYGGIGLGLSIVSRIVQLHRFQFFLENRRDRSGCRAVVKF